MSGFLAGLFLTVLGGIFLGILAIRRVPFIHPLYAAGWCLIGLILTMSLVNPPLPPTIRIVIVCIECLLVLAVNLLFFLSHWPKNWRGHATQHLKVMPVISGLIVSSFALVGIEIARLLGYVSGSRILEVGIILLMGCLAVIFSAIRL